MDILGGGVGGRIPGRRQGRIQSFEAGACQLRSRNSDEQSVGGGGKRAKRAGDALAEVLRGRPAALEQVPSQTEAGGGRDARVAGLLVLHKFRVSSFHGKW